MSKKNIDTTLRDSFLERIKKPGCPSVKTIAEGPAKSYIVFMDCR